MKMRKLIKQYNKRLSAHRLREALQCAKRARFTVIHGGASKLYNS